MGEVVGRPPSGDIYSEDVKPNLQFVERIVEGRTLRILQQLWVMTTYRGPYAVAQRSEWRDVPLVTEG